MMMQNRRTSFLFGENVPYIEQLYESYLDDANSVSGEWREYFEALQAAPAVDGSTRGDVAHAAVIDKFVALSKHARPVVVKDGSLALAKKQVAVQSLIAAYRMLGTRQALLDPLNWSSAPPLPELTPGYYGLSQSDLDTQFSTADTYFWDAEAAPLRDIIHALDETYGGTLGAEFAHIADAGQRQWWQMRLESTRAKPDLTHAQRKHILERLTAAEGLEKYLHTRYVGQTRFSLEGGESLIVLLDELLRHGVTQGVKSAVLGMAHRGRLNVLVNTIGKPARMLFDEFEGKTAKLLPAGDVKYHKGFTGTMETDDGAVEIELAFNPSHLEIVNPVVQGMARAKAEKMNLLAEGAVLPVEIHGDVALSGQGVVMETMNLSYTKGHGTGGTVHIVINNQIGFTTSAAAETRSTFYSTDIAKFIEAPVLHVNADDPEAVVEAARLAIEYRTAYKRNVVIDLVCFRRHGHQEQDTPNITQPLMYRSIAGHPGARALYAQKLVEAGMVTREQVEGYANAYRDALSNAHSETSDPAKSLPAPALVAAQYAAPALDTVRELGRAISEVPEGFKLHPLVAKVMSSRREMADGLRPLDWGMAEHLAFASLLASGTSVRLSGQDSERGTFAHRHAVLNNQSRQIRGEGKYLPLDHVSPDQARFTVNNSILSESAVLAFEYGYSSVRDDALVLWEAQYGDFANGAQVVIDNFISAAAVKWGQDNGVTMLLPHGQDGAGPEHASARLERYLQLCAQENILVCQPTMPAQFFHLLRRQAMASKRKPLIVMTPKSLLRNPEAVSSLEDLAGGRFNEILGDTSIDEAHASEVERAIVISGKVYFDLVEYRRTYGLPNVALIRVEQLYPFPKEQLAAELARYPNLKKVVWSQEEPRNQGAWKMVEEDLRDAVPETTVLHDACRDASPSTAPGYPSLHMEQQINVVRRAFTI